MEKTRRAGPKSRYDWKRLQKGKQTATRGVDFHCNASSFVSLLHRRADTDRMDVSTSVDGDTVTFEFVKPKRKAKRGAKR
jgi:hypothetical protein